MECLRTIIVSILVVLLVDSNVWNGVDARYTGHDDHGGVPMGIPRDNCDNGRWNIELDWDDSTNEQYRCQSDEKYIYGGQNPDPLLPHCLMPQFIPKPIHVCMDQAIIYEDHPPVAGRHRPLWPVYGEYLYLPPQRWLHSLEHGAAVFLYHPCATQVKSVRKVARSCLRKHIITPSRELDPSMPYAVLTYGCKLLMKTFDEDAAVEFVKNHAMTAPESHVQRDGDYDYGLLRNATTVSPDDTNLCPQKIDNSARSARWFNNLMIAENMGQKSSRSRP